MGEVFSQGYHRCHPAIFLPTLFHLSSKLLMGLDVDHDGPARFLPKGQVCRHQYFFSRELILIARIIISLITFLYPILKCYYTFGM